MHDRVELWVVFIWPALSALLTVMLTVAGSDVRFGPKTST